MAATSKPVPKKRLADHLQDEQEPFTLENYLSERSYMKRGSISETRNGPSLHTSSKSSTRATPTNGSRTPQWVLQMLNISCKGCRKLLKRNCESLKGEEKNCQVVRKCRQTDPEMNCSPSYSMISVYGLSRAQQHECRPGQSHNLASWRNFQALKLQNLRQPHCVSNTKHQWGCMDETKQLSPISVLEQSPSGSSSPFDKNLPQFLVAKNKETPSICSFIFPGKAAEDSIFTKSRWELLVESLTEKQNYAGVTEYSSQCFESKRVFMQPKQLVFDSVREAIDTQGSRAEKQRKMKEVLGPEELGKMACEQIFSWDNQCGHERNLDRSNTEEKWSNYQLAASRDIGIDIGEAILDDILIETIKSL